MAEVRVLLDPGDDMRVSVGLLERHDPARGQVVVHPTPGGRSLQAFAHDLLGALGRAVNRLDAEQLAGSAAAWRAVTAWMATDQIEDLVVLRADRLLAASGPGCSSWAGKPASGCCWSATLRRSRRYLAAVLSGTGHQVLTGLPAGAGPPRHTPASPAETRRGRRGQA